MWRSGGERKNDFSPKEPNLQPTRGKSVLIGQLQLYRRWAMERSFALPTVVPRVSRLTLLRLALRAMSLKNLRGAVCFVRKFGMLRTERRTHGVLDLMSLHEAHFKQIFRFWRRDLLDLLDLLGFPHVIETSDKHRAHRIDVFCWMIFRLSQATSWKVQVRCMLRASLQAGRIRIPWRVGCPRRATVPNVDWLRVLRPG